MEKLLKILKSCASIGEAEGKFHHGVVQKGKQSPVLAGKIAVEGFSGNADPVTELADGDILIALLCHQLQKPFFQCPLPGGGLLSFA